jgi:hypothetical protein
MPTDTEFLQLTPEQEEYLKRSVRSINKCGQCDTDVGMLGLAGVDFRYAGLRFCCGACLEEWLDSKQDS